MPVEQTEPKVTLKHPKGSSCEVLLYGATVTSWLSVSGSSSVPEERLFVSSKAAVDGSKPVRGGIPVVFPCFGPPSHPEHSKLSQHGFARNSVWSFAGLVQDDSDAVSVKLSLQSNASIAAVYPRKFTLAYIITLYERQLRAEVQVTNDSPDALPFQLLLHNYLRSPANEVQVTALQGVKFYDKTAATEEERTTPKVEERPAVDVRQFTDSVYENAPQDYRVSWPGGGLAIKTENFKDVVVWNPQAEAGSKIGDMEDGGWERYVCVEPGNVRGFVSVEPGKTWISSETLSVV